MSRPDYISVGGAIPPRFAAFPHGIVLLPAGVAIADLGDPGHRFAGIFLLDPDCAQEAMNDPSFEAYLASQTPILVYASRARDLRPFFRRAPQFRARNYTVEAIA